jgi:hypothetical protein
MEHYIIVDWIGSYVFAKDDLKNTYYAFIIGYVAVHSGIYLKL